MPATEPVDNFEQMKSLDDMYDVTKVFDSALLQTSTIDFIDKNSDGTFDMSYSKIEGADNIYAGSVERKWEFYRVGVNDLVAEDATEGLTQTIPGSTDSGVIVTGFNNRELIGKWNIKLTGTYERKVNEQGDGNTRLFQSVTFVKTIITPPIVTLNSLTQHDDTTDVIVDVKISGFSPPDDPSPNFTVVALPADDAWNTAALASLVYDQGSVTNPQVDSTDINNTNTYKLSFTIPYKIKQTDPEVLNTASIVVVVADQNLQGHVGNL